MMLLVDIGNSRVKWAFSEQGKLSPIKALEHGHADFKQQLLASWQSIVVAPEKAAIACVSSVSVLHEIEAVIKALWSNLSILNVASQAHSHGVINSYPMPEKLGIDRWLCLIAARARWHGSLCIVDCGSAVTIDVMAADGQHLGGLIGPGMTMMKRALAGNTAALKFSEAEYSPGLANNTEAAIYNGTLYAVVGLIHSVLEQQKEPLTLIVTGGDAELVVSKLKQDAVIAQDLVLQGLNMAVENNEYI